MGQVGLGLIVGLTLYFHPAVTIKEKDSTTITENFKVERVFGDETKAVRTNVPFLRTTNWITQILSHGLVTGPKIMHGSFLYLW